MKPYIFAFLLLAFSCQSSVQPPVIPFEESGETQTATYKQAIAFFQILAKQNGLINIQAFGMTDSGYPLHLVTISNDKLKRAEDISSSDKTTMLIMNAIHPGEPDGVDACMMLARDFANGKIDGELLDSVNIAIIPIYNIGGALRRNGVSRANQNGPEEYGFRGNARNLDLNRDFIKNDSRNTQSFSKLFISIDPDIFIDTHVTNGADYPYVMTLIATQQSKLMPEMAAFQQEQMLPFLFQSLEKSGVESIPFVNIYGKAPDKGWPAFFDGPRYSTGWAAIHFCYSFVTESHMFKPFSDRVWATYHFIRSSIDFAHQKNKEIQMTREAARQTYNQQENAAIKWQLDTSVNQKISFSGYQHDYYESPVTGLQQIKYDRSKIKSIEVPYYNHYAIKSEIRKPSHYLISKTWSRVISILKNNGIKMQKLKKDSTMRVEANYIKEYETYSRPNEGHYAHYNTKTVTKKVEIQFYAGDYIIPSDQRNQRFLYETLEPEAPDSFFNWNFFDAFLVRKEYFSSYIFDAKAKEYLDSIPGLQEEFEKKRSEDENFAASAYAQLDFIYERSPHYESVHRQMPVFKIYNK